jgi:hypothetical protein
MARCAMPIRALVANHSKAVSEMTCKRHGWFKPRLGFVKLNVDAAFNSEYQTGAAGAIIGIHSGPFLMAASLFIPHVSSHL